MIAGAAHPAANAQILAGLHEDGGPGHGSHFGAKAGDHLARADLANVKRFEADEHEPGIGGSLAAGEGYYVGHGGIGLDGVDESLSEHVHFLKGHVLGALNAALDRSVVLQREKALGHDD